MGKWRGNWGKIGGNFARRARRMPRVLMYSHYRLVPPSPMRKRHVKRHDTGVTHDLRLPLPINYLWFVRALV